MGFNDHPFVPYMKPMFFSKENDTVEMRYVPVSPKLEPKYSKMSECSCPQVLANSAEYFYNLLMLSVSLGGDV